VRNGCALGNWKRAPKTYRDKFSRGWITAAFVFVG
jgi:hypothetical protein